VAIQIIVAKDFHSLAMNILCLVVTTDFNFSFDFFYFFVCKGILKRSLISCYCKSIFKDECLRVA